MPAAPDIPTLYDFETAYESALANYFANLNGAPFAQVLTPTTQTNTEPSLETPRVTLALSITGTGDKEDFRQGSTTANYYSHKVASLALSVATCRSNTAQNHGNLRGRARQAMLEVTAALNSNTVPYYQTIFVTEQSSSQAIDPDNDEIITQLTYGLEFWIKPDSWPAS